ncbi:nucleolar protein 8 [Thoreauomyces humboldtii]|nr:nucleolar protein 8 [Thoreauomyces humboldtii]
MAVAALSPPLPPPPPRQASVAAAAAAAATVQDDNVKDPNAIVQKRLYISGLKDDIASQDIEARFKSFGNVTSVHLAGGGPNGGCRGFGYVSLEATLASIGKCMSLYNGSKWKGMQLHIEEAKQDYTVKLKREWQDIQTAKEAYKDGKPPAISNKKLKKRTVEEAADMTLVTDRNMKNRKHWRRSAFGRAVSVYHYKDPVTRKIVMVDPLRYKHSITRPESYAKFTPVTRLTWPSDDIVAPKTKRDEFLERLAAEDAADRAAELEAGDDADGGGLFEDTDDEAGAISRSKLDVAALYDDERGTESESESDDGSDVNSLFRDDMDVDPPARRSTDIKKEHSLEKDLLRLVPSFDDQIPVPKTEQVPTFDDGSDSDDFEVVPASAPAKNILTGVSDDSDDDDEEDLKTMGRSTPSAQFQLPPGFSDDSDDEIPSVVPPPTRARAVLTDFAKALVKKEPGERKRDVAAPKSDVKPRIDMAKTDEDGSDPMDIDEDPASMVKEEPKRKKEEMVDDTLLSPVPFDEAVDELEIVQAQPEINDAKGGPQMETVEETLDDTLLSANPFDEAVDEIETPDPELEDQLIPTRDQIKEELSDDTLLTADPFDEAVDEIGIQPVTMDVEDPVMASPVDDPITSVISSPSDADADADASDPKAESGQSEDASEEDEDESERLDHDDGQDGAAGGSDDEVEDLDADEDDASDGEESSEEKGGDADSSSDDDEDGSGEEEEETDGKVENEPNGVKEADDKDATGAKPTITANRSSKESVQAEAAKADGDRHYAVNTNLRALVFGSDDEDAAPFSLFGDPVDSTSTEPPAFDLFPSVVVPDVEVLAEEPETKRDDAEVARSFGTSSMFFLHVGDTSLAHRSKYAPDGTFKRTETVDEIKMNWEDSRQELTQDFKSKHKLASRKKEKMKRQRTK